jgi:predicted RNA-binding Zn ribbon-like protein
VLRELAWASLDLLSTAPIARIKLCPACGFAFLDTTKNGTRRWCSMAECGTREKARRYVAKRAGRSASPER